ncbi:MAG: glycosyltransferase family 4 protein, partial [Leptolyngbyaceae cyanobacterium SL_5_14]|nr:glycosyltransferase family 4 protein [Leptolyngbyaceae cyanobacterium SL_5_14]
SEVIAHGKTGFLCHSVEECVEAIARLPEIDRRACREHVLAQFSVKRMVDGYEAVYRQVLSDRFIQNGHLRSLIGSGNSKN